MSHLCSVVRRTATIACVALLVGPATAQLSDFEWHQSGDPSGSAFVTETEMHIVGPAFEQCTTSETWTYLTTVAPLDGVVHAHLFFTNQDGSFGWWVVEDAVYVVNGVVTKLTGDVFDTWEGDVTFPVSAGDTFGFGVQSADCFAGPGILDVTGFVFAPDMPVWPSVGSGLAGVAGTPLLVGFGSLEPGSPWMLSLINGAPSATSYLVAGFSLLELPFKGGVLVPTPTVLVPLVTGPLGRILLDGDWPGGLPPGTVLALQYWIVDAVGPAGFSASNGVSQVAP